MQEPAGRLMRALVPTSRSFASLEMSSHVGLSWNLGSIDWKELTWVGVSWAGRVVSWAGRQLGSQLAWQLDSQLTCCSTSCAHAASSSMGLQKGCSPLSRR
jgi:hypothetical protein